VLLSKTDARYPLRYEDGRVSSESQQVNAYFQQDANSIWEIEALDPKYFDDDYKKSEKDKVRYLRHNSLCRFKHVGTGSYLLTHDVASPLTKTNMEVAAVGDEAATSRYNETVWKIVHTEEEDMKIRSKKDIVYIINNFHNVALHTYKTPVLPEWAFRMQVSRACLLRTRKSMETKRPRKALIDGPLSM
jgi:dolichyl-phosphate-mannose-protein mannosyltransferase